MAGNMNSGRKRKPSEQRKLEGNRSKTPIPDSIKAEGYPAKPEGMPEAASQLWDRVIVELHSFGARKVDESMLQTMCEWWGVYRGAMSILQTDVVDKEARIAADRSWSNFEKAAGRFGMDPSSRARMSVQAESEDNPLAKFGVIG